jgi:hypothetical protein
MLYINTEDFNGDGIADLAFTPGGYLYTCLGHGHASLGRSQSEGRTDFSVPDATFAGDRHYASKDDLIVGGEAFSGNGCDIFDPAPLPVLANNSAVKQLDDAGGPVHFGPKVMITNEIAGFRRRPHALAPQIRHRAAGW